MPSFYQAYILYEPGFIFRLYSIFIIMSIHILFGVIFYLASFTKKPSKIKCAKSYQIALFGLIFLTQLAIVLF